MLIAWAFCGCPSWKFGIAVLVVLLYHKMQSHARKCHVIDQVLKVFILIWTLAVFDWVQSSFWLHIITYFKISSHSNNYRCTHHPTLENAELFGNNEVSPSSKKRRTHTLKWNRQLSELNWYKTSENMLFILNNFETTSSEYCWMSTQSLASEEQRDL